MGGPSSEHAISLKSGHGIADALAQRGWNVRSVEIPHELTVEQAEAFVRAALSSEPVDVVFIALHGPFGEDGTVQEICEELGLPYTGSDSRASRRGMDKVASRRAFVRAGLRVPKSELIVVPTLRAVARALRILPPPVVVKPTNQGSSIGVSLAHTPQDAHRAVDEAAKFGGGVLIEEFVRGREVTAGVLGDQSLPIVEIQSSHAFFDFTAKYTPGETRYLVPAPLDEATVTRVQLAGLIAHRAVGCRHFSRTDVILNDAGEAVVLEVNTIPGFTATSLLPKAAGCVGISYPELCERITQMALLDGKPRRRARKPVAAHDSAAGTA